MYSPLLSSQPNAPNSSHGEAVSGATVPRWVETLVDCPNVQGFYHYSIPEGLHIQPGDILSVPFGSQQIGAVAIQLSDRLPDDLDLASIRPVDDLVCRGFFPPTYWALLQQTADYYCTSLMQVVRTALPPGLLGRSQRRIRLVTPLPEADPHLLSTAAQQVLGRLQGQKSGDYTWKYLQQQVPGAKRGLRELLQEGWVESYLEAAAVVRPKQRQAITLVAPPPDVSLSPRQQEILDVLKRRGGDLWLQELLQISQVSSSVLKGLERKGCVVIQPREVLRLEGSTALAPDQSKPLTADQQQALLAITTVKENHTVLLHGVTGSGKTEVYLQAIAPLLAQGKSALVLVPEIGLTPQLTDRFRARFSGQVQVYHSALSDGERYDTWRQMLSGIPQVVIGTRSAIFAPLPNLGLIVLDEEHDSSFKQDQPAPCYHARTVAHWRSTLDHCPLILGSATPSLETWLLAHPSSTISPNFLTASSASTVPPSPPPLYLSLPTRIHARPMPPIQVVDMRQELQQGNRSIFSRSLQSALIHIQTQRQQGILFMHRRGHSTFVSCRSCGQVLECPHCDISLTYHQSKEGGHESLRCHYCSYGRSHPSRCPSCDSPYLKHFGSGTQRVMQELTRQFPDLRCLRFDSDTTRAKGAHRALLSRFAQGEADILVGTQMLTKGIDLPQVTLVGVVAADGLLHLADYRASERAFQTLTQVAGRAGRGDDPGRVILQTYSPEHPVIQAVQRHEGDPFMRTEQEQRAALHYPPYGHLVLLRLSSPDEALVQKTADAIANQLQAGDRPTAEFEILGPAPAAVPRVARRHRWQILLKYQTLAAIDRPMLMGLRTHCPAAVSLTIDIDPLNLM